MASPAGADNSNMMMAVVQRKRQKVKELPKKSQARPHSSSFGSKVAARLSYTPGKEAAHSFSKGKNIRPKSRKPRALTEARTKKIQKFFNQTSDKYELEDIRTDAWKAELLLFMNESQYGLAPSDVENWIETSSDLFQNAYSMSELRRNNAEVHEPSVTHDPPPPQPPAAVSLAAVKTEPSESLQDGGVSSPQEVIPRNWAPPRHIFELKSEPEEHIEEMNENTLEEQRDPLLQQLLLAYSGNVDDLLAHIVETVLPPGNESMQLMTRLMYRVLARTSSTHTQ